MMLEYIVRLLLLVALVSGLAVLSLWLYRRLQAGGGLGGGPRERAIRIVDAVPMGPFSRLAVVEFGGRRFLLAVSRGRVDTIAESDAPKFAVPDDA